MEFFEVGKILGTHGLKGEIKVMNLSDDEQKFEKLEYVYIDDEKYFILKIRYHKTNVLITLKDYEDINKVERLKGKLMVIPRELGVELNEDEYYLTDLIGLKIIDNKSNEEIGNLKDVIRTGANDVYVIDTDLVKNDLLLPAIKQCIKEVNVTDGYIKVEILDGLID
ncbi:MAG: ribosome maturation factor RimM [Clostridia bacterium]|jgi:16S rRNA processing protein RimM|nr:ribosome maturation factor RimM [Clostridia bacterium]